MMNSLVAIGVLISTSSGDRQGDFPGHLFDVESQETKIAFVRELRLRSPALAKEFLEREQSNPALEPSPHINLELARTHLAVAKSQPPRARGKTLKVARDYLVKVETSRPSTAVAVAARVESARIDAAMGRAVLFAAFAGSSDDRAAEAKKARDYFDKALAGFAAAVTTMPSVDVGEIELERALTLLEKSQSYPTGDSPRLRAEAADSARRILSRLAKSETGAFALLVKAHLVRANQLLCHLQDASRLAMEIEKATEGQPSEARRVARYYSVLSVKIDPDFENDREREQRERTIAWLRDHPASRNSFEGQHLRFEQLVAVLELLGLASSDGYSGEILETMNESERADFDVQSGVAEKIAVDLVAGQGDFSERAARFLNTIRNYQAAAQAEKSTPNSP